ncbi:MAG TPA: hypothetical protein VFR66_11535 [Burkholderiales bacterium]|nr:hypothetical protein [Burkholderiales bacterium]
MRHPRETFLAAALAFTSFAVIDSNIRANEVAIESNIATPRALRVVPIGASSSTCDAPSNRPAFCSGSRSGLPPTERFPTR